MVEQLRGAICLHLRALLPELVGSFDVADLDPELGIKPLSPESLGLAMLAISFNTVRLQVLTRVEESAVLSLFGATRAHVRRPFLYFGAVQGLIAALMAWAVAALALWWLEPRVSALIEAYGLSGRLSGLGFREGVLLIALSSLVGLIGGWLGATKR